MQDIASKIYTSLAQSNPLGNSDDLGIPKVDANAGTINTLIAVLLYFAGTLSVIFIVIGGIMYMFSAGNPDTAKKAKNIIIYAIIGLVVVVLSYAIINTFTELLNGKDVNGLL